VRRTVRAGGMSISLRESCRELYILYTEWERGWFYLRNDEPAPPTPARSWGRRPTPGDMACPLLHASTSWSQPCTH
jgi:hypothetical protein